MFICVPLQEGHHSVVELLLLSSNSDATGSAKQRTPLHLAAANGHAEVCGALLMQRAMLWLLNVGSSDGLEKATV